jgi:glycine/D-amino acid oxidase-like deaminating enzyme
MKNLIYTSSGGKKFCLTIIGAGGAIGLPASYLASLRGMKVVMVDSGSGAIDNSTHTVHTSIVRPNRAVWPFSKAVES